MLIVPFTFDIVFFNGVYGTWKYLAGILAHWNDDANVVTQNGSIIRCCFEFGWTSILTGYGGQVQTARASFLYDTHSVYIVAIEYTLIILLAYSCSSYGRSKSLGTCLSKE